MGLITVVGAGLLKNQLTFAAAEALSGGGRILLHTDHIGCAEWLKEQGIAYESLDALYDAHEDFDEHAEEAAACILKAAGEGDVVYVVYDVRDRSVLKLSQSGAKLRILAGPPVEGALMALLDGQTRMLEASGWEDFHLSPMDNALVRELNSRELASEVKLRLMDCYPDETTVYLLDGEGNIARLPLYDMDRLKKYDHRSCVLVPAVRDLMQLQRYSFDELVQVMRILQGPNGCPWDKAQTHESLRKFMLEETYECIDAINEGDTDHLYDELGDLLMQVVLHAEIGRKHGEFDISDATTAICQKMIDRHSHIFGGDSAGDPEEVLDLWTRNKMKERGQERYSEVLREVSRSIPALMRAYKLIEKAQRAGVAPQDTLAAYVSDKVSLAAQEGGEDALGDALWAVCVLARRHKVDPEIALNMAANRFVDRFEALEKKLEAQGMKLPAEAADAGKYWESVKL